jgi:exodeoxyribonuclease V alpha subunit
MLDTLADWADRGWLRRLDAALARFVADVAPSADGVVLLATALVAHLEGQGHTCLALDALLADPAGTVGWSEHARLALEARLAEMPRAATDWIESLSRCKAVSCDGAGGEPLVLVGTRLYLRRYWYYERRVASGVKARLAVVEAVDEAATRGWLDRLFPEPSDGDTIDWQKVACALALRGRLAIVTGGPGTGKTFTAARFLALLYATSHQRDTLRIALAAPTGKAAARLEQSITAALAGLKADAALDGLHARIAPARTLHGLLGTRPDTRRFRHDASSPLAVDVVVVDEASMVHVEMMQALLDALPPHARLLLLGDKDQLASVEAGAVLGELCRDADRARYSADTARYVEATCGQRIPDDDRGVNDDANDDAGPPLAQRTVMLRVSRRFSNDIGALAQAVNAGDASTATGLLSADGGATRWMQSASPQAVVDLALPGYRACLDAIGRGPASSSTDDRSAWIRDVLSAFERFRVLCAVREGEWGVAGLNRAIAARFAHDGLLAADGEWYEGRPVMVTRNDADLGVFNGDIGIALRLARGADLRACFVVGSQVRTIGVGRLGPVETAFAMTVHKSQGSEFDHTVLVLPPTSSPVITRELVYTGITRARSAFTLVSSGSGTLVDAIARTTRRSSGLLAFIDAA